MKGRLGVLVVLVLALSIGWIVAVRLGPDAARSARDSSTREPRNDSVERSRRANDLELGVVEPDLEPGATQRVDAPSAGGRELLAGKVTWSSGGHAGFARVEVRAEREPSFVRELTTDGFGNFRFEVPDRGPYRLAASREKSVKGLRVALDRVECVAVAEHVLAPRTDLKLALAAPFEVRGRVVGPDGVAPRAFHVLARLASGAEDPSRVVDTEFFPNDGAFALVVPHAGAWDVFATAACFEPSSARSIVVDGIEEGIEFALGPTATVRGLVLDPDGVPVAGARVFGGAQSDELDYATLNRDKSGYAGEFSLVCLRPGAQAIVADGEGWAPSEPLQLTLTGGVVHEGAVLRLRRGATLDVSLRFAHPSNVRNVRTSISTSEDGRESRSREWIRAEEPQSFACSFQALAPGPCTFVAEIDDDLGRRQLTREIDLVDGAAASLECVDEAAPRVRAFGRVTCGGEPAQEFSVVFRSERVRWVLATTNDAGEYEVALPTPGAWTISCDGRDGEFSADVAVPDVERWRYDVELGGARIAGRLVGAEGLTERLQVELESEADAVGFTATAVSESDRSFEFPNVPPGRYTLTMRDRRGRGPARATWIAEPLEHVVVRRGDSLSGLELRLVPAASLTVVLKASGELQTVRVARVFDRTQLLDTARAFPERGRAVCSFDALPPGEVRVLGTCGGRCRLSGWITLGAGPHEVVLDLEPAAYVAFEFVPRDLGDSVESHAIVVPGTDEPVPVSWGDDPWDDIETNAPEAVLPPGTYELVVRLAGGRSVRTRFEAPTGEGTQVLVRLD